MSAALRRFLEAEDGTSTIEFTLFFPFFFTLFLSTFELGMFMTRQVMLDRAVDLTVRAIRLGAFDDVTREQLHDEVRNAVCAASPSLPNCLRNLKLEMQVVDPRAWAALPGTPDCVDRKQLGKPVRQFSPGEPNDLMLLRACLLYDPYFPTTGIASSLPRQANGDVALLTTTAFAIEPERPGT